MKEKHLKKIASHGMATVEAMLVLPLFMGFILAFISYASLGIVESKIQYAADQTAKEISQYYYVAFELGLNYNGVKSNMNVDTLFDNISKMGDNVKDLGEGVKSFDLDDLREDAGNLVDNTLANPTETFANFSQQIQTSMGNVNNLWELLKALVDNAKKSWESAKKVSGSDAMAIGGNAAGAVMQTMMAPIVSEACFWKYINGVSGSGLDISGMKKQADPMLKQLNVVDGASGLDFSHCSFLLDGQTIKVVVTYEVKLFSLGFFDIGAHKMCQVAATRAWFGNGDNTKGVAEITTYK